MMYSDDHCHINERELPPFIVKQFTSINTSQTECSSFDSLQKGNHWTDCSEILLLLYKVHEMNMYFIVLL